MTNERSQKLLSITSVALAIFSGVVFMLSASTKLISIESTEYTLVDFGLLGWQGAALTARLLIAAEFACGVLLITNVWMRRLTLPVVFMFLFFFCLYLVFVLIQKGNNQNCGCFGEAVYMSPIEALIKNIAIGIVLAFVYRFHPASEVRWLKLAGLSLLITVFVYPFVYAPLHITGNTKSADVGKHIPLHLLYESKTNQAPAVDVRKGKWVVAYLSLTCHHCRIAAKKLRIMHQRNPALPIYLVLNGKQENMKAFFEETQTQDMKWNLFNGKDEWLQMAGNVLPKIYWLNNGVVDNTSDYYRLEQRELEQWLSE